MKKSFFAVCLYMCKFDIEIDNFVLAEASGGRHEKKLLRDLMVDYDNLERPVVNESHPLVVTFGVTLQQIIDVVSNQLYSFVILY